MAGARRQRARVRPHARRSVAARHRRRSRLRRARDTNRQTRRVHRRARHHECAAGSLCIDVRSLATLVTASFGRKTLKMSISNVTAGDQVPREFNVIIEIPMNADPIKYEVDKESGALFVDRFMMTAMHYPANYGYVPQTISEDDDPVDVLVHTPFPAVTRRRRALPRARLAAHGGRGGGRCQGARGADGRHMSAIHLLEIDRRRSGHAPQADSAFLSSITRISSRASGCAWSAGPGSRPRMREILGGVERHAAVKSQPTSR